MNCPLCLGSNATISKASSADEWSIKCLRCGNYAMTGTAKVVAEGNSIFFNNDRHWLPYTLRQIGASGSIPIFSSDDLNALKRGLVRPTPTEAADNLIRYLGEQALPLGQFTKLLNDPSLPYRVGVRDARGVQYLVEELEKKGLLNVDKTTHPLSGPSPINADLTFDGWARYQALLRGAHSGRHAFMALQFGDAELDNVVENCFKPATVATGFELRRLNDPAHQRAGLIDDELRVQIKASRFLMVDLTHNNNGAYWEAGYGEGLGKPVIYTCKKQVFDCRTKSGSGTHFDTNHHLHILWDTALLHEASARLKACIRATVPEAKPEPQGGRPQ